MPPRRVSGLIATFLQGSPGCTLVRSFEFRYKWPVPNADKLAEFTAWCQKNITGDEKGHAQIFLDRLFQAFGQSGCFDKAGQMD